MSTSYRDQYHHYIPRFILRRFKLPDSNEKKGPQFKKGKKKQQRIQQTMDQTVHYFDMDMRKLEIRPIARVYGYMNLYKDVKNIDNANHLEEELGRLETLAAQVIIKIHDALAQGQFCIDRKNLESLRKFLFIMFYRKAAVSASYYDNHHPENFVIAEWIERVKAVNAFTSQVEVWLHFLHYFLATPHQELIARAQKMMNQHGMMAFIPSNLPDSAKGDYPSIDYLSMSSSSYLGVVEAADGTEFVLSDNSWGLWEGLLSGLPAVHRLFVVSPRVAFLLRTNMCRPELGSFMHIDSSFTNIQIQPPKVEYQGGKEFSTLEELMAHRHSPNAQRDLYHFRIIKLTRDQTQEVNNVVLLNAKEKGSITFLTKSITLKALQNYSKIEDPILPHKKRYTTFMAELMNPSAEDRPTESQASCSDQPTKDALTPLSSIIHSLGTLQLSPGAYDGAYKLYSAASMDEPAGRYIFDTVDYLIEEFRVLRLPEQLVAERSKGKLRTNPFAQLVENLPEADGLVVMVTMKHLLSNIDVKKWEDPTTDEKLYEAAIVGLLDWLVKNKGDVLAALFSDIVLVKTN